MTMKRGSKTKKKVTPSGSQYYTYLATAASIAHAAEDALCIVLAIAHSKIPDVKHPDVVEVRSNGHREYLITIGGDTA